MFASRLLMLAVGVCLCGCPKSGTSSAALRRSLSLPLGKMSGACVGSDRHVRPHETTTVAMQMDATANTCRHAITWQGRLLDFAKAPLGESKSGKYELSVASMRLVDALGNAVEAPGIKLAFELTLDGTKVVALSGDAAPYGTPLTKAVVEKVCKAIQRQHAQRQSLDGTIALMVDLKMPARKTLSGKAAQPQLEVALVLRPLTKPQGAPTK